MMQTLNPNWITEGHLDFEYKKWLLLAYLQHSHKEFDAQKLYPILSDLHFHYQNLLHLKNQKKILQEQFPKELSKADFEKLTLHYKEILEDDNFMRELEAIIQYALPLFSNALEVGKNLYQTIEEQLKIAPIGITPLYFQEGYLFFSIQPIKNMQIYRYQTSIFENAQAKWRGLHLQYVETVTKSLSQTYENLKVNLSQRFPQLPNPATFLIEAPINPPFEESLFPIAKRLLLRYLSHLEK